MNVSRGGASGRLMASKNKEGTLNSPNDHCFFARGRSTRSNVDGWSKYEKEETDRVQTTLTAEKAKVILSHNDSPDIGFDRSVNPYRGCEHGCIYCFARLTHAYLGLCPGLDFENQALLQA